MEEPQSGRVRQLVNLLARSSNEDLVGRLTMKHFLGVIPPSLVVLLMSVFAWAEGANATTVPGNDLTSVIAGVGTGGLTIWFCLKWVQSELVRHEEKTAALIELHTAEMEKLKNEGLARFEEIERRWRHDYNNIQGLYASEKDLRLIEAKDFAERLNQMSVSSQNITVAFMEGVKGLAKLEEKISGTKTGSLQGNQDKLP